MLPKILIITDQGPPTPWAYWFSACQIKKFLINFDIDILCQKEFLEQQQKLDKIYDNIYFMNFLYDKIKHKNYLSSVNSHQFELNLKTRSSILIPRYKALSTISKKIYDILTIKFPEQKFFCCENGVDLEEFYPGNNDNDIFTVGFVGRDMKGTFEEDLKAINTVLLPLKERMSKYEDIRFLLHLNNHKNSIPHKDMVHLYHQMDCFLVTSFREGTGMAMEASACSIPSICTDVGVCSRVVQQPSLIVPAMNSESDIERTISGFEERILFLKNNRDLSKQYGLENLEEIKKNWQWKDKAKEWEPLFNYGINGKVSFLPQKPIGSTMIIKDFDFRN